MSQAVPYLGSKISLISKAEIRYEGTLYTIDPKEATVALAKVRSFGTEDRPTDRPLPARNEVFEFIIFRGHDIKDLHVCEPPKHQPTEGVPPDPAIVKSSQPPPGACGAEFHGGQPGFQGQNYQPFAGQMYYGQGPAPGFAAVPQGQPGSQGSTPPPNRKSPTSDQGVQVQPRSLDKPSHESHPKSAQYNQHQSQQHPHHHHHHPQHIPQHQQHHPQQHHREFPRGQGVKRGGGGGQRMERMDNRDRAVDPRSMSTSYARGRSSNRGPPKSGPLRGGLRGAPRGHGQRGGRSSEPLKFDTDFDFETSNAQFDKEDIEKELKNLSLSDKSVNGDKGEEDPEVEEEEGEDDEESGQDETVYYDRKKSFFDNISCEATERTKGQRTTWREERKLNSETFGISENYRRNYRGRGNWRGNPRGGWRGRGRGGGFNNRDGGNYYGNRGNGRGRRSHGWDYNDRRRMDGPPRVEVRS